MFIFVVSYCIVFYVFLAAYHWPSGPLLLVWNEMKMKWNEAVELFRNALNFHLSLEVLVTWKCWKQWHFGADEESTVE